MRMGCTLGSEGGGVFSGTTARFGQAEGGPSLDAARVATQRRWAAGLRLRKESGTRKPQEAPHVRIF